MVGGRAVFTDMSVHENLQMQALAARMDKSRLNERREVVYETFPALAARHRQKAGNLSGWRTAAVGRGQGSAARPQSVVH